MDNHCCASISLGVDGLLPENESAKRTASNHEFNTWLAAAGYLLDAQSQLHTKSIVSNNFNMPLVMRVSWLNKAM